MGAADCEAGFGGVEEAVEVDKGRVGLIGCGEDEGTVVAHVDGGRNTVVAGAGFEPATFGL